jgi:hypothetical protein
MFMLRNEIGTIAPRQPVLADGHQRQPRKQNGAGIRQQPQVLRDMGLLQHTGPGCWHTVLPDWHQRLPYPSADLFPIRSGWTM